jgi:hypothetical protein
MKLFFRHKDTPYPHRNDKEHNISLTGRNFMWLEHNDATLKFRVSLDQEQMIDEACSFLDISASDFIRQILFVHLYGRYDLLGLLERQLPGIQEGRSVIISGPPEESTKKAANLADFKIYLPFAMKDDLAYLAKQEGSTLSRYVRTVVVTHLTGHPALAENSIVNHTFRTLIKPKRRNK